MKIFKIAFVVLVLANMCLLGIILRNKKKVKRMMFVQKELNDKMNSQNIFTVNVLNNILVNEIYPVPEKLMIFLPNEACASCVEKIFLALDKENLLSKSILFLSNDKWLSPIQDVNEIYYGELSFNLMDDLLERKGEDLIVVTIENRSPIRINVVQLDYFETFLEHAFSA